MRNFVCVRERPLLKNEILDSKDGSAAGTSAL